jgi:hypothetical protein
MGSRSPHVPIKLCVSYFISPLTRPRVFGWLLCKIVVQQPPKAKISFISFNFLSPQLHPNRSQYTPPAVPAGRSSFHFHPSLRLRFFGWLSCVVCRLLAAAQGHERILFFHFIVD